MSQTGLVVMTCPLVSVKALKTLKTNKTPLLTGLIAWALKERKKMLSREGEIRLNCWTGQT